MEYGIEVMVGIVFFVLGLSILVRAQDWENMILGFQTAGPATALTLGMVNLLLGALIVGFHWVWSGIAALVTLFGVLFLVRATILLLHPAFLANMVGRMAGKIGLAVKVSGGVALLVGALVLYDTL